MPTSHYLKYFASVYCIALVLLLTVLIFGLNLGGLSLLPTLIACAFIAARHFVRKELRLPYTEEKVQLIWGSSAVALIIGSFFVFFMIMMNPNAEQIIKSADQAGLALSAIIMLLLVGIHGAIFHIAYNSYARFVYNRLS